VLSTNATDTSSAKAIRIAYHTKQLMKAFFLPKESTQKFKHAENLLVRM
jgi:hypothetical protein